MLSHLAGRTRPCPRGKRQKRVSSRTGGIVPEPHQYTSMGTSSPKFRGPTTPNPTVHGTAGPKDHDSVQQEKCSWNEEWLQCRRDSGQHPGAGRGPGLDSGAIMGIKLSLGHRLRIHNVCTQPREGAAASQAVLAGAS